ncbi:MAG: ATP-binding cassette domain-containing protein [Desulfobacterales bacterium]|nr:MAG: ATP-binding cassette domain-containing protein [Desulfobacterales bacterium]
MSDLAIKISGLSKRYRIGIREKFPTIRETLMHAASAPLHKVRHWMSGQNSSTGSEWIWALSDVDFEVKQGEVIGIIGRNGAGKTTLLKVLSGITEPTAGYADIYGRVGSLLEVGTGFHMELTGRENIFMNGAILGMRRQEIKNKFDEIVAFSEIERFLDTPVKRYSSGMYVRLAFAVAAHLEPEILIVDEVLSVGDIRFQKKCLGKMQDISHGQGRTVLFVSHNMDSIQRLCSHCIILEQGKLIAKGDTASTIQQYASTNSFQSSPGEWIDVSRVSHTGTSEARFVKVQYSSLNEDTGFQPYSNGPLEFLLVIMSDSQRSIGSIATTLYNLSGAKLVNADSISLGRLITLRKGLNRVRLRIEKLYLNPGIYRVGLWLAANSSTEFDHVQSAFEIEVVNFESQIQRLGMRPICDGVVTCKFELLEVT